MSFYSKISLCALLAAGTALGMELPLLRQGFEGQAPRLNASAQSQAAQALNQPMIKVFSDRGQIDTIQSNYLEASETLKNMLHDVDQNKALVLPESMIEDYVAIKDLLAQEYRLNAEITDERTVINILKSKTEQQLVAIANASQRFELNKVGECAVTILAEQLNAPERKEKCLRDGSYNLMWTPDVARLVAVKMKRSYLKKLALQKNNWLVEDLRDFANRNINWLNEQEQNLKALLNAEEIILLEYCFNCRLKNSDYDMRKYPGITTISQSLSSHLKKQYFPNWWQRRSWLSKAAIITGGAAATGLAAWYGYKYFSKNNA